MRKPDESLDDYVVRELEIQKDPPRTVSLRFTGEVEVLKPLAVFVPPPVKSPGLSWFHRSLVAGGAFALIAIVLGSAVFIGMYESQPEVAQIANVESDEVRQVEEFVSPDGNLLTEELPADVFTASEPEGPALATTRRFRISIRPAYSSFAVRNSTFKQRRVRRPISPLVSAFIPTTLIIYIDKGEVKSRIEPQLTAGYKKIPTLSN